MADVNTEKKKRKGPTGPRKVNPLYLVYRSNNGEVEVLNVTRDAFAILAAAQNDSSVKYVDVSKFMQKDKKPAVAKAA